MLEPGQQVQVAFLGVGPVASVGPFAQRGLDEAFGFAIGTWGVGSGKAVTKAELGTGVAKLVCTIAAAVIGEQSADADAVLGIEVHGIA